MKRFLSLLGSVLPHISIICTGMITTFLVIEIINPYAGFISHAYTRIVLWVWVVSALLSSILLIAAQRREFRRKARRRHRHESEYAAERQTVE